MSRKVDNLMNACRIILYLTEVRISVGTDNLLLINT